MKIVFKKIYLGIVIFTTTILNAQVTLEKEVKITDDVMYFNGNKVALTTTTNNPNGYDYVYGRTLTPHGDCVKVFDKYVFMTWYRGGKEDRHVMLSRYNTETGVLKTIEFPHRHTGYNGRWWIGETHNTIAIGICPKDGTIHMLYDQHRNADIQEFVANNDVLRYSYSEAGAATVPDNQFTIERFVNSSTQNYKHQSFPGITGATNQRISDMLTYPAFFVNDQGDLFVKNRFGFAANGKFVFLRYDGTKWNGFYDFNRTEAQNHGSEYSWGLYGDIKFVNGKIRIGFQRRSGNRNDKYIYQNGMYYAYSDNPDGTSLWKDHLGVPFNIPLGDADRIKIYEPGDLVTTTQKDQVYIVNGFDWTVTENEDVHFIGKVRDTQNNKTVNHHTYKPAGATEFITSTDFSGAETIYASGNNIYMIGLNGGGRPFVQKALGGTNQFTKVYEQTSGKKFEKGELFIHEGKVYYYLLEDNTANNSDSRTTYLQIINLNIQQQSTPFAVNLVSPTNNQSFNEGETVQLFATASADEGEITKVQFFIDNDMVNEDTSVPYSFDWTPNLTGSFIIKAVAFKTGGTSITSTESTIQINEVDKSDLTRDIFRLQNVATGQFLGASSVSAQPVLMHNGANEDDKKWKIVKVPNTDMYNIDNMQSGIIRATGAGFATGPYLVVSTTKDSPAADSDKVWTIHYNEANDTFRFEAATSGRFLYHNENGNVYSSESEVTDQRSVWKAVLASQVLSTDQVNITPLSIKVYPNPAKDQFTITLPNQGEPKTISIYNTIGALIYHEKTNNGELTIQREGKFKAGIYLIKVNDNYNKAGYTKLLIE